LTDHVFFVALQGFLREGVRHGPPFTRVVAFVDDREDVVPDGLAEPGVEGSFFDVGFWAVDAV
jgi:hypothetical protein